ncbi:MAG: TlpA family protein disulfide reductase [Melioribacteraceae bacterium]|nr:TlpA family protein disulfide reductase [Melioribacteraceae bacterium]MCF8353307.1 TlpA family protein disulfide reductase [Melioribacteraceae bacterium]MCF8393171.1 TlpA family protein disulfide reductase [Melioribacteraceae bacterium]MCF8419032.1 TlpA family protein disulfide reductase [Melioribacteraceae bacterium]
MSQKNNKQKQNDAGSQDLRFGLTKKQRSWLYTGIFFTVVLILFVINNSGGESEQGPYPPNYVRTTGETISLSDYEGKVVLLDFWATWCPPCRRGIPDLIDLKNTYGSQGFEVIGISMDGFTRGGRTKQDVVPFMEEFGINYPIVYGTPRIADLYGGVQSIPTSFIIDREGRVFSRHVGLVPKSTYEDEIKQLLSDNYIKDKLPTAPDFDLPAAGDGK